TFMVSYSVPIMKILDQITSLTQLACSQCGQVYSIFESQTFATCCNKPLVAKYDLHAGFSKSSLRNRAATMWRYLEVLPVFEEKNIVSLGEGMSPILEPRRLRSKHELPELYIKDES